MTIRRWTLVSALVATLAAPATALAQSAPPPSASAAPTAGNDEVTLNNGGMIRGTVVSVDPNREVTILVQGTGELRHLPWADVGQVNRGKYAPAPPAVFPASPLPPPPLGVPAVTATLSALGYTQSPVLAPPEPGEVGAPRVHIESPTPVTLHETVETDLGRVRPIDCTSPCDRVIDGRSGQVFFFAGDEIPQSSRFHMVEKSGDVTVRVSPGSAGLRTAGSALIGLGITGAVAGAVVLPVGMAVNAGSGPRGTDGSSPVPLIGGVTLGVGAAMLVTGIVMNVVGHTRYDFATSAAVPGGFRF